jgi:hypothetical protein
MVAIMIVRKLLSTRLGAACGKWGARYGVRGRGHRKIYPKGLDMQSEDPMTALDLAVLQSPPPSPKHAEDSWIPLAERVFVADLGNFSRCPLGDTMEPHGKAARGAGMRTVAVPIPDDVLFDMRMSAEEAQSFARRMTALGLYRVGGVSLGHCSEIAGMGKPDFIRFLGENVASIFQFDDEQEFLDELANAEAARV